MAREDDEEETAMKLPCSCGDMLAATSAGGKGLGVRGCCTLSCSCVISVSLSMLGVLGAHGPGVLGAEASASGIGVSGVAKILSLARS